MFTESRALNSPAADAARLLGWLGLVLLLIVLPSIGLASKNAIYVLVPIGAALVLLASVLTLTAHPFKSFSKLVLSPLGLGVLFFAFWAALSLVWTPFPADGAERLIKTFAMVSLALAVAFCLPERTRPANLYLLPVGLLLTAVLSLGTLIFSRFYAHPASKGFSEFDESLFERSILTLIVLIWPAMGALSLRERWISAAVLVVLVASVAIAGLAQITLAAMGAGALTFALAMSSPRRVSLVLAGFIAALIATAPALPLLFGPILPMAGFKLDMASPMAIWAEIIKSEGPRLITGHGLGVASQAVILGFLPLATPKSVLFIVWYELGVLGALSLALFTALAFIEAGRAPQAIAPALLGGLVTILTVACFGLATVQIWWINLVGCCMIAFVLLIKGIPRLQRPKAGEIPDPEQDSAIS